MALEVAGGCQGVADGRRSVCNAVKLGVEQDTYWGKVREHRYMCLWGASEQKIAVKLGVVNAVELGVEQDTY